MKIVVPGASGLVGSAFVAAAARRGHQVTAFTGTFNGEIPGAARQVAVDLADATATQRAILEEFPDAIVNCAAVSVPEQCEANPALSHTLNVQLPTSLATLAHHLSARLVHISSEQAFDGTRTTPYAVTDATAPINLYGRQKVESEQAVHAAAAAFAVTVRAPLLMGNSAGGRRSTHERLLADWAAGKTARLYSDEFRQPCTAENLAEVLLELAERRDVLGVTHWAGAELISRFDLGRRIREHFKLTVDQAPIAAVVRADHPDAARKRQACLAIDVSALAGRLKTRPQSITEQLEELKLPAPVSDWYFAL